LLPSLGWVIPSLIRDNGEQIDDGGVVPREEKVISVWVVDDCQTMRGVPCDKRNTDVLFGPLWNQHINPARNVGDRAELDHSRQVFHFSTPGRGSGG
jgi:hypothetical protein